MDGILEMLIPVIVAIITGVIGPAILLYLRKNKIQESSTNKDSSSEVDSDKIIEEYEKEKRQLEIDQRVQAQLREIREHIGADRSWVIEFHNGGKKVESIDTLKKFSMVYESVGPGISKEKQNFDNLLISFFVQTIQDLIEEKELLYESVETIDNYEVIRIFEQKGNSSMYMFAMETIDDLLVGILGVDFVRIEKSLSEEEIDYLRMQSYSLAGFLEASK